jgi:hypothetical protein
LIAKVEHDQALLSNPKSERLLLHFGKQENKALKNYFIAFYENFNFCNAFFDEPSLMDNKNFDRQDFLGEFLKINDGHLRCVICDSGQYYERTSENIYASIEHFFPKSIYPHLAIHPKNLIPICHSCNSFFHGDVDLPADYFINDVILPYQEKSFGKHGYVAVVKNNEIMHKKHPLKIELKADLNASVQNMITEREINSFESYYKIQKRWNEHFDEIEAQVYRRLEQFLMFQVMLNGELTRAQYKFALKSLIGITNKENMGKDPNAYLMIWILQKYLDDVEAFESRIKEANNDVVLETVNIYKSLKMGFKKFADRWKEYEQAANELKNRMTMPEI